MGPQYPNSSTKPSAISTQEVGWREGSPTLASPSAGSCRDTSVCDTGIFISMGMKLSRSQGVLPAKPLHRSLLWSLLLLVLLFHLAVDGNPLQRELMGTLGFSTQM